MFNDLIAQFATLAGVAAFVAMLVNACKSFGLPDGYAPKVSAALSLAAFVALVGLKIFRPEIDVTSLDKAAADLATLGIYILGFLVQIGLPAKFHEYLSAARVPFIGKSYTTEKFGG